MTGYHDDEWGVPLHDDHALFEFLILEGAQAGLSWSTILRKRENYRAAFDGFDAAKIARYTDRKQRRVDGRCRNRSQSPEDRRRHRECSGVPQDA
jgi:DNA-3-methyladenine glycosylase I